MVGYGEVGKIFTAGLLPQAVAQVSVWDLSFDLPERQSAERAHATQAGVPVWLRSLPAMRARRTDLADFGRHRFQHACGGAGGGSAHPAWRDFSGPRTRPRPAPEQQAAESIDAAGGHYVEAGVMTSVPPHGIRVPMLLGGARAEALAQTLCGLGMDGRARSSPNIGVASAIKTCRQRDDQRPEAPCVIESYTTARHYGVDDHMLPTLAESFPSIDWNKQGARSLQPRGPARQAPRRGNARGRQHRA